MSEQYEPEIYVAEGMDIHGPFTLNHLQEKVTVGIINPNDVLFLRHSYEGWMNWEKIQLPTPKQYQYSKVDLVLREAK